MKFLKDNLRMCEKAIDFLKKYIKDWLEIEGIEDRDKDVVKEEIETETMQRTGKKHKYHMFLRNIIYESVFFFNVNIFHFKKIYEIFLHKLLTL